MKLNDKKNALAIIDELISESPLDPFFHELKGDILKVAADVNGAIRSYTQAIKIIPWAALIRVNLARMQLALNNPKLDEEIILNVRNALRYENKIPALWRQLATVYGRRGQTGKASLALAEEAMLKGDLNRAKQNVKRALGILSAGSPEHIRAQDIENEITNASINNGRSSN